MTATNGIDPQKASRWLGEILRVYTALDEQKIENMNKCKRIRERFALLYEAAKNEGLPLRAFKLIVKQKLIEKKIDSLEGDIEDLKPEDEDDGEAFEMLQAALGDFGDTPLGGATLEAAADKKLKAEAKKAAKAARETKPENQGETSTDAVVAANTAAIEAGIKTLNEDEKAFDDATAPKPSRRQQRSEKLDSIVH